MSKLLKKINHKTRQKLRLVDVLHKKILGKATDKYTEFMWLAKSAATPDVRKKYYLSKKIHYYVKRQEWEKALACWSQIEITGLMPATETTIGRSQIYRYKQDYNQASDLLTNAIKGLPHKSKPTNEDLRNWLKLSKEKAEISFYKRCDNISDYQAQIDEYIDEKLSRDKKKLKIAFFTAVSGGYDTIKPPAFIDPRVDYIVFTDTPIESIGIYDVRPLPYIDADGTRSARYVKTNPHYLLQDYDIAVWIDANLLITGDIYPHIEELIKLRKPFAAMRHAVRESPYDEMEACIRQGRDDKDAIMEQRNAYISEGYDSNNLIESNVLIYDLRDNKLNKFLSEWWNQIDRYSRRDQLSINYSLDKHKVDWHAFTEHPDTARNHPSFALMDHGDPSPGYIRLMSMLNTAPITPSRGDPYYQVKTKRLSVVDLKITAVVCVHNAYEDVKKCLNSIKKHKHTNQDLIIIDDGSDKETAHYLKEFSGANKQWVTLIRHRKAYGYTKSASEGLSVSKADFTILLNSDTIVTKDWAMKMADVMISNEGVGIVGPLSSAASHQSVPNHISSNGQTAINDLIPGFTPEDMNLYCEKWSYTKYFPRVPLVHGFCLGVSKDVIDKIGTLDEKNFPRGYGEENDYCFRAANAGFNLAIATNTYVYHSKSKSFIGPERQQLMEQGMSAFVAKHGQRRIDRAVKTMQNNDILVELRERFGELYNANS